MEATSAPPSDSNNPTAARGGGGASKFLANVPSRGLFSSTVLSSTPDGMRVYVCDHDTSPPEGSKSRTPEKDLQSLTVERLRALLKEKGLSLKGRKDELIARLKGVNG